jgi:hypothetical protein
MNLRTVPAREGLQWALLGIRTFWRQPLAMSGLFFFFMAVVSLVSMVPLIGGALALVLLPGLTAGIMAATQKASEGLFPMPAILFSAFKTAPARKAMLTLGGLYALGLLLLMAASMLADGGGFAKVYLGGATVSPELVNSDAFQAALWTTMLLYVPLSMLFWHAPALVYWQQIEPVKSLFFSWMACWRNKAAFTVYTLAWVVVFVGSGLVALLVASLLGDAQMLMAVLMPLALMVTAMFFTSMLFTVKACFSASTSDQDLAA